MLQPQLSIQKSYVVCIYVQYTDILLRYKMPEAHTHVPHHTQRGTDSTDGGSAFGAAPIGSIIFPLCVVWHVCVSLRHFIPEQYVRALHIYTHYIWFLYGQLWLKNMISESILAEKYEFWLIIRLTKVRPSVRKTKRIENLRIADLHTQKSAFYHKSVFTIRLQLSSF